MPGEQSHSFSFDNNILTVKGVAQVVEIAEKQSLLKLSDNNTMTIKGSGLNVTKLDKEQGVVVMEVNTLTSLSYHQGGLGIKGWFR